MTNGTTQRVDTLDATKGVLVIFMVAYHCLNYSTRYSLAFKWLSFLPPSFILITGFLLANVYLRRLAGNDRTVTPRLLSRGVKLLTLFTVLNLAANLVYSRNYHNSMRGAGQFIDHWVEVYFVGGGRLAVFEILVPIAYLLLFAPLLLAAVRWHAAALPVIAGSLLTLCAALEWSGDAAPILNLIVAGVLGILFGRFTFAQLDVLRRWIPAGVAAYAAYAVVGQVWGQPFLLQVGGAVLALIVIYGTCLRLRAVNPLKKWLVLLGEYSLLAYIAQIGILQVISHFAGRPKPVSPGMLAMALATVALTTLTVEVVAWSRRHLRVVAGAYRVVFA